MKQLLKKFCLLAVLGITLETQAQEEFPKGWVMYLEALQGAATNFHAGPDQFVGNLQLSPQLTLIPDHIRVSAIGGTAFYNKKFYGTYGAGLNWRLSTISFDPFGSLLNLQVQLQHLWGTDKQRLVGGGLKAELGQIFLVGISAHRDYQLNEWWLQTGIGFNLLHKKKKDAGDPFEK
ncbi:MAG: hypothetical protein INR73_15875 [Williamsia sp.]|nr:hypothetical protein [Williamsia sp.]